MTACWEPGTQYNYDDVVEYEGHRYKIIQPHRSQSDWTPPITPALWGRLSDQDNNYGGGDCNKQQQPYHEQQQPQQYQQQGQYRDDQQSHDQQQDNDGEKKHWYGDEENKKKLEIGGGIAAGALALGAGLLAYKKHEQHKEQGKADEWSHNNWLEEAKARRDQYQNGSQEAAIWVLTHNQIIPRGAILVGKEHSWNLFIARAPHEGGLHLGKASEAFKNGGVLGYKNREVFVDEYEVLVGDMSRLRWVPYSGRLNVQSLGYRPVEGGRDADGTLLYVVEAPHNDAVHPGRASEKEEGAYIAFGGKEVHIRDYRVLCYNNSNY